MDTAARCEVLRTAELTVEGRILQASNATLLATFDHDGATHRAVYKPVAGERPLPDFPTGTLAAREVAAHLISEAGGWGVIPPTVLRDGPYGPGSVQWWVDQSEDQLADPAHGLVEVMAPEDLPEGWLPVVEGEDEASRPVVVAHADDPDLASVAVLDVVLNNADRKAGHLTRGVDGRLAAFDHGLTCHVEDKLRTVLWGFAGRELPVRERTRLEGLDTVLGLSELLTEEEIEAVCARARELLAAGTFPSPPPGRYPLPWPLW